MQNLSLEDRVLQGHGWTLMAVTKKLDLAPDVQDYASNSRSSKYQSWTWSLEVRGCTEIEALERNSTIPSPGEY